MITFCFSHNPPPHTSTLFPYTTLFRSLILDVFAQVNVWRIIGVSGLRGQEIANIVLPGLGFVLSIFIVIGGLDRKSKRLNSSHVAISYAVFCLKKKKKPGLRSRL